MSTAWYLWAVLALCAASQAASQRHFDMSDATTGELTWATLPVGHGYANLFVCPDAKHAFIVDMGSVHTPTGTPALGPELKRVFQKLLADGLRITSVFVSHPNNAHANLFKEVFPRGYEDLPFLQRLVHGGRWEPGPREERRACTFNDTALHDWFSALQARAAEAGTTVNRVSVNDERQCTFHNGNGCVLSMEMGKRELNVGMKATDFCPGGGVSVVAAAANLGTDRSHLTPNSASMVLRVQYRDFVAVLPGDFEGQEATETVVRMAKHPSYPRNNQLRASVAQLAHHGAYQSHGDGSEYHIANRDSWLKALNPQAWIISATAVGKSFHYPQRNLIHRLLQLGPDSRLIKQDAHLVQTGHRSAVYDQLMEHAVYQTTLNNGKSSSRHLIIVRGGRVHLRGAANISFSLEVREVPNAPAAVASAPEVEARRPPSLLNACTSAKLAETVGQIPGRPIVTFKFDEDVLRQVVPDEVEDYQFGEIHVTANHTDGDGTTCGHGTWDLSLSELALDTRVCWQGDSVTLLEVTHVEAGPVTVSQVRSVDTERVEAKERRQVVHGRDFSATLRSAIRAPLQEAMAAGASPAATPPSPAATAASPDASPSTDPDESASGSEVGAAAATPDASPPTDPDESASESEAVAGGTIHSDGSASWSEAGVGGTLTVQLPLLSKEFSAGRLGDMYNDATDLLLPMVGIYNPGNAAVFSLVLVPDTTVHARVGPFELAITEAQLDLQPASPSSSSPLALAGTVTASVSFPLFLSSSLTVSACLTLPRAARDPPMTLDFSLQAPEGVSLTGGFAFFGQFHPKNVGTLYLRVPGITVTGAEDTPPGLTLRLPDYFSGATFNVSGGTFSFAGVAGSGQAGIGASEPWTAGPTMCFPRLVDDVMEAVGASKAPRSRATAPTPSTRRRTAPTQKRAAMRAADLLNLIRPARSNIDPITPTESAGDNEATTVDCSQPLVFPPISLPEVDWTSMACSQKCLESVVGGLRGQPVRVPTSGYVKDLVHGLPLRLLLPPDILGPAGVQIDNFFAPGRPLALRDVTADFRRYSTRASGGNVSTVIEGVIAASAVLGGVDGFVFAVVSTHAAEASGCGCLPGKSTRPTNAAASLPDMVRMFFVQLEYTSSNVQLTGTLAGLNAPGFCSALKGDLTVAAWLGRRDDVTRVEVDAHATLRRCGKQDNETLPAWTLEASHLVDGVPLFGSELTMSDVKFAAQGWTAEGNVSGASSVQWHFVLSGKARHLFGLDVVSAEAELQSSADHGVSGHAQVEVDATIGAVGNSAHIQGSLVYISDRSASGSLNVSVNIEGVVACEATGDFMKHSSLQPKEDKLERWRLAAQVHHIDMPQFSVNGASVLLRSYLSADGDNSDDPDGVLDESQDMHGSDGRSSNASNNNDGGGLRDGSRGGSSNNGTQAGDNRGWAPRYAIHGRLELNNASLIGNHFISGTATIEWDSTRNVQCALAMYYCSSDVTLTGNVSFELPVSDSSSFSGTVTASFSSGSPMFVGSISWCGASAVQCNQDDSTDALPGQGLQASLWDNGGCGVSDVNDVEDTYVGPRFMRSKATIFSLPALEGYVLDKTRQAPRDTPAESATHGGVLRSGSAVVQAFTRDGDQWVIGPFVVRRLSMVMQCHASCCAGLVIGSADLDLGAASIHADAEVMVNSKRGVRSLTLAILHRSDFVEVDARLTYDVRQAAQGGEDFTINGSAALRLYLPVGDNGQLAGSGRSRQSPFEVPEARASYSQLAGSPVLRVEGSFKMGDASWHASVARNSSGCWSGELTSGSITLTASCAGIAFRGNVSIRVGKAPGPVLTGLVQLTTNSSSNMDGCHGAVGGGSGTAVLSNLPWGMPDVSFGLAVHGCQHAYQARSEIGAARAGGQSMFIPLPWKTTLAIGRLATVVDHPATRNKSVAVFGTLHGADYSTTTMDVVVRLKGSGGVTIVGVLQGPLRLGDLLNALTPGATHLGEFASEHLGDIESVALVLDPGSRSIVATFTITMFPGVVEGSGLQCEAQLVIAKDKGKLSITVHVAVEAQDVTHLPQPLNILDKVLPEGNPGLKFVFSATTARSNPARDVGETLQELTQFLEGLSLDEGGDLLHQRDRLCEVLGRQGLGDDLFHVQDDEPFGPGIMLFAAIGNQRFADLAAFQASKEHQDFIPGLTKSTIARRSEDGAGLFVRVKVLVQTRPELHVQVGLQLPPAEDGQHYPFLLAPHFKDWRLRLREAYVLVKVTESAAKFGFGIATDLAFPASIVPEWLRPPQEGEAKKVISLTGKVAIDTSGVVDVMLRSDTDGDVWKNPLGLAKHLSVVMPLYFRLGLLIEGEGTPTTLGLGAGIGLFDQVVYGSFLVEAMNVNVRGCFHVESLSLHKLLSGLLCVGPGVSTGSDCLGLDAEALLHISVAKFTVAMSTGGEAVMPASSSCGAIEVGFIVQLSGLRLFDLLEVDQACLGVTTQAGAAGAALVVQVPTLTLGQLTLQPSQSAPCAFGDPTTVSLAPCASASANMVTLLVRVLAGAVPEFAFVLSGRLTLLGVFDVDVCFQVERARIFADVQLELHVTDEHSAYFLARLSTSIVRMPPALNFGITAAMDNLDVLQATVLAEVNKFVDGLLRTAHTVLVELSKGFKTAKEAVARAKEGVNEAQKLVDTLVFSTAMKMVAKCQSAVNAVKSAREHERRHCSPWPDDWLHCAAYAKLLVDIEVAEAALKLWKSRVEGDQQLVDGAFAAAVKALGEAEGLFAQVSKQLQAAADTMRTLSGLVNGAIHNAGSLLSIKHLSFSADLHSTVGELDFRMRGVALGYDFDISFQAKLNFLDLVRAAVGQVKVLVRSSFGTAMRHKNPGGLPYAQHPAEEAGEHSLAVEPDAAEPKAEQRDPTLAEGLFVSPLVQDTVQEWQSPMSTTTPAFPHVPGAIAGMCDSVTQMLGKATSGAINVDMSNFPDYCPDFQPTHPAHKRSCLLVMQQTCVNTAVAELGLWRQLVATVADLEEASELTLVARLFNTTHASSRRAPQVLELCNTDACRDDLVSSFTGPLSLSLAASHAHGVGALQPFNLKALTDDNVRADVDLSHNSFNGTIPDDYGSPSLVSLVLAHNQLDGGLEQLSGASNLVTLDLSHNVMFRLQSKADCLSDVLRPLDALHRYRVENDGDILQPIKTQVACVARRGREIASFMKHDVPGFDRGVHVQVVFAADQWAQFASLCGICFGSTGALDCLGKACINASVLSSLQASLSKLEPPSLTHTLQPKGLPLWGGSVRAKDIDILAIDRIGPNKDATLVTYRVRSVIHPYLAMQFVSAMEKHIGDGRAPLDGPLSGVSAVEWAGISCGPGLVGPLCTRECPFGWKRYSSMPADGSMSVTDVARLRRPRCEEPVPTWWCPSGKVLLFMQRVTRLCDPSTLRARPDPDGEVVEPQLLTGPCMSAVLNGSGGLLDTGVFRTISERWHLATWLRRNGLLRDTRPMGRAFYTCNAVMKVLGTLTKCEQAFLVYAAGEALHNLKKECKPELTARTPLSTRETADPGAGASVSFDGSAEMTAGGPWKKALAYLTALQDAGYFPPREAAMVEGRVREEIASVSAPSPVIDLLSTLEQQLGCVQLAADIVVAAVHKETTT